MPSLRALLLIALSLLLTTATACQSSFTAFTPQDLDSGQVKPSVGADLLSAKAPPDAAAKDVPVVVTAHGYGATSYENKAILDYLTAAPYQLLGSRVMLGAHGTNVYEFEKSSWQDWQKPLETELDQLESLGYKHINVLTTSTGGSLMLELLSRKRFAHLEKLVMVAPLVSFSNKTFQFAELIKLLGIRSIPGELQGHAVGNWYRERPVTTLVQLSNLTNLVRQRLEAGLILPTELQVMIVQSNQDGTVDPVSAGLLAQGLKGGALKIRVVSSKQHVPTAPYPDWAEADYTLQKQLFTEIGQFYTGN